MGFFAALFAFIRSYHNPFFFVISPVQSVLKMSITGVTNQESFVAGPKSNRPFDHKTFYYVTCANGKNKVCEGFYLRDRDFGVFPFVDGQ